MTRDDSRKAKSASRRKFLLAAGAAGAAAMAISKASGAQIKPGQTSSPAPAAPGPAPKPKPPNMALPPGPVPPYGAAINDALRDPNTKLSDMVALRNSANATLRKQGDTKGDLKAALQSLNREIARRQKQ